MPITFPFPIILFSDDFHAGTTAQHSVPFDMLLFLLPGTLCPSAMKPALGCLCSDLVWWLTLCHAVHAPRHEAVHMPTVPFTTCSAVWEATRGLPSDIVCVPYSGETVFKWIPRRGVHTPCCVPHALPTTHRVSLSTWEEDRPACCYHTPAFPFYCSHTATQTVPAWEDLPCLLPVTCTCMPAQ